MRKAIYSILFLTTLNLTAQDSNFDILQNTITILNTIESVLYTSRFEGHESKVTYIHSDDSIFFQFANTNTKETPKYYIKNKESELIYNGKDHIQSMANDKLIVTGSSVNPNNPLLLTLYPIRELLPQLINNDHVEIKRKNDTVLSGKENYAFDFILKNSFIDWEQLTIKTIDKPKTTYYTYTLFLKKSDNLPSKIIMPNGPTGTMSRTIENVQLKPIIDPRTWTGELLPSNYKKVTLQDYIRQMEEEMKLRSKGIKSDIKEKQIEDWTLPDLHSDEMVNFSKFKGNVVLLEFWFKYCGPCVKAVPELNELNLKYKKHAFVMYGVEFRDDYPKKDLQAYASKINIDYPVLYKGKELALTYSVRAAPTFMIIDKKGTIVYLEAGFNKEKIEKIINEHL